MRCSSTASAVETAPIIVQRLTIQASETFPQILQTRRKKWVPCVGFLDRIRGMVIAFDEREERRNSENESQFKPEVELADRLVSCAGDSDARPHRTWRTKWVPSRASVVEPQASQLPWNDH